MIHAGSEGSDMAPLGEAEEDPCPRGFVVVRMKAVHDAAAWALACKKRPELTRAVTHVGANDIAW